MSEFQPGRKHSSMEELSAAINRQYELNVQLIRENHARTCEIGRLKSAVDWSLLAANAHSMYLRETLRTFRPAQREQYDQALRDLFASSLRLVNHIRALYGQPEISPELPEGPSAVGAGDKAAGDKAVPSPQAPTPVHDHFDGK